MADKALRLSLSSYPPRLDISQFYPALSTYRVDRAFEYADLEKAVGHFLADNPFFRTCHLVELRFPTVGDFPISAFQEVIDREYPNLADGFMVASVTYSDDPHRQGIFTVFPMSLQDGYRCFHFHQLLMRSIKTGSDEFVLGKRFAELGVRVEQLPAYLPAADPAPATAVASELPIRPVEEIVPVRGVVSYLDTIRSRFLARDSENLIVIRNALGPDRLPLGNFLLFAHVDGSAVREGNGADLRARIARAAAERSARIAAIEKRADFLELGRTTIPDIARLPHRYVVNNYGDVSAFDGSDIRPERGRLEEFRWYMPGLVLGLMSGPRDGVSWTVTVGDRALDFRS